LLTTIHPVIDSLQTLVEDNEDKIKMEKDITNKITELKKELDILKKNNNGSL
jgi:hypothetical protein